MHGPSARSNFIQANNRYRFDEIHLIKDEQPSMRIVDEQSSSRVEKWYDGMTRGMIRARA